MSLKNNWMEIRYLLGIADRSRLRKCTEYTVAALSITTRLAPATALIYSTSVHYDGLKSGREV